MESKLNKRVVILGCDSTHANEFIKIISKKSFISSNLNVVGIWDYKKKNATKLQNKYKFLKIYRSISEAVDDADVILISNRFGEERYKIAKETLQSSKPTFLDKPITMNIKEAKYLENQYSKKNIKVFSSSAFRFSNEIQKLKKITNGEKILGGDIIGPYECKDLGNDKRLKNIFFYGIHLVEIVQEVFGNNFRSVSAKVNKNGNLSVIEFSNGLQVKLNMLDMKTDYYSVCLYTENNIYTETINLSGNFYSNMLNFFFEYINNKNKGLELSKTINALKLLFAIEKSTKRNGCKVII